VVFVIQALSKDQPHTGNAGAGSPATSHLPSSLSLQGSYLPFLSNLYTTDQLLQLRFDRSRNTLYALAASSTIQGFWLGRDGTSIERFATRSNLQDDAICRERVHSSSADFEICAIWPVPASESSRIHLLALTTSGLRIYLTTTPSPAEKPYSLQVVHVDNVPRDMKGAAVRTSYFAYGCLLLATMPGSGSGASVAAPDSEHPCYCFHFNMASKELRVELRVAEELDTALRLAPTSCIGEAPLPNIVVTSEIMPSVVPPINVSNELATQHFIKRRFLCLTTGGIYFVERRRPVDKLADILSKPQGNDSKELNTFFDSYKHGAEPFAMCLMIACQQQGPPGEGDVAPTSSASAGGSGWIWPESIRERARREFRYFEPKAGQISGAGAGNITNAVLSQQQQQPTERYQGFCMYLARLLAPVWLLPINCITVYTQEEVLGFRNSLFNLLSFMRSWVGGDANEGNKDARHFFAARPRNLNLQEQQQLPHLLNLLDHATQALEMLIVLNNHDYKLIDSLLQASDAKLTTAPFRDLVAGQVAIVKPLVTYLMESKAEQTDLISEELSHK
jgi:hypothetical protein